MKRLFTLLLLIGLSFSLLAQKKEFTVKEYFADAEYFLVLEHYQDALNEYLEVYKRGYDNNSNINYRIGICYLNIPGKKERAINFLEKASLNASIKYRESTLQEVHAPYDVYLYLGNAYRINYQLDSAVVKYQKYLSLVSENNPEEKEYVEKQIEACYVAKEYISSPRKVVFNSIGKLINTSNSNYNAVVSGDGNTLVYMTSLPFYEGIFMSKRRGSSWARPINITPQVMSDGDQLVTGISYDGSILLLAKADAFDSDIYISHYSDGKWGKSKPVDKNINTKFWESHASLSKDGRTIYFTSNRKGGLGAMDIYMSELDDKGKWGDPINLGPGVNTQLNEDCPFVTHDGKKLYYSSQGHRNIGGYDFFVSELSDTIWTNPQNLRYPISTTDEDLFYLPMNDGEKALVNKIMEDGHGGYDLYTVEYMTEEDLEIAIAEQIALDVDEEAEETGLLADSAHMDTIALLDTTEVIVIAEKDIGQEQAEVGDTADILVDKTDDATVGIAAEATVPAIIAEGEGKVDDSEDRTEEIEEETLPADVIDSKEEVIGAAPEKLVINLVPVLFGFDQVVVSEQSIVQFDEILHTLLKNETTSLILTGHTDALGPESYNLYLSERRAREVAHIFIKEGVNKNRIEVIGKGEQDFVAINRTAANIDSPEGRKYNRRVELRIQGVDTDNIEINYLNIVPKELRYSQ